MRYGRYAGYRDFWLYLAKLVQQFTHWMICLGSVLACSTARMLVVIHDVVLVFCYDQSVNLNLTAAVKRTGSLIAVGDSYIQSMGLLDFDFWSSSTVLPPRLPGPVCGTTSRALNAAY